MTKLNIRKIEPQVSKILGVMCDHVLVNFVQVKG